MSVSDIPFRKLVALKLHSLYKRSVTELHTLN